LLLRGGVVVLEGEAQPTPARETSIGVELNQEGPDLGRGQTPSDRDIICAPEYTWNCDDALAVFRGPTPTCPTGESGGRWEAINPNNNNIMGGFQIDYPSYKNKLFAVTGSYDRLLLLGSRVNTAVAHLVYLAAGSTWDPWDCKPGVSLPSTGIGRIQ
jgi:hypothetical protein